MHATYRKKNTQINTHTRVGYFDINLGINVYSARKK